MLKNQKGITLVALVITIIVLLILAGVSISLVVGNNGVLTQASTAVVKTRNAEYKQAIDLAIQTAETNYFAMMAQNGIASRTESNYTAAFKAELENQGYTVTMDASADILTAATSVKLQKDASDVGLTFNVQVDANGQPTVTQQ